MRATTKFALRMVAATMTMCAIECAGFFIWYTLQALRHHSDLSVAPLFAACALLMGATIISAASTFPTSGDGV